VDFPTVAARPTVEFFFSPGCSAVYGSDTWPIDEATCVALAAAASHPGSDFLAMLRDPDTARIATATAEEAVRRGAFGVPTFFLGAQMFWGNDRLALLRSALAHQR
jgi:2-hydroxychromene-2-carboxylate isomerase